MEKKPRVSVLIPTYNYGHFIEEAVNSVLNQTFEDFELIIVDDASKDNTEEIIQPFLSDPRVTYLRNATNIGLVNNFNKSLEYASGEFIKYLMADDRLHNTLLEKFVQCFDAHPEVGLVTAGSATYGSKSEFRLPPLTGLQPGIKVIESCVMAGRGNWIGEPTVVMFRRQTLGSDRFNTNYICLVDLDLWLRLLVKSDCFIIDEVLAYFRMHDAQASDKKKMRNWFDEYYFYRDIKRKNVYNLQLDRMDIDKTVKRKAKKCVKRMLMINPRSYKKGHMTMLVEAVKIGISEHIIW